MGLSKKPPHPLGSKPALEGRKAPRLGHVPVHAFEGVNVPKFQPDLDADKGHDTSAMSLYLNDIGRYSLITVEEEVTLAARIKLGDEAAREKMIRSNLRLVVRIAQDYANFGLPILDLIAEGNLGLMKAVERFDPTKGGKLSTYAAWWIKQHMKRALSTQIKTIRLPIHVVKELNIYLRAARELSQRLDHEPTPEEIAAALDRPVEEVRKMLKLNEKITSVDTPVAGSSEKQLLDVLADEKELGPETELQDADIRQHLVIWLDELNAKQREVLARRFGLLGYEPSTLEDVGKEIGLTRERVRQIQVEALRRLREIVTHQGLNIETLFQE